MKSTLTIFKWLLLCLFLPLGAYAVKPYSPIMADPIMEPWRWQHDEALEGFGILCMDKAADGTLWFGAPGKIIRYDGETVTAIDFDDTLLSRISHSKAIPWTKTLLALPDGNLLALIGESLLLRSGNEWDVVIPKLGHSLFTASLKKDLDENYWLVVPNAVWRISADFKEVSIVMKSTKSGFMGSLCIDQVGNIWIAEKTDSLHAQLVSFPTKRVFHNKTPKARTYALPVKTDATEIWITAGTDGSIWYADDSARTSLARFNPNKASWTLRDDCPTTRYFSISSGRDGTIWAGGEQMLVRIPPTGTSVTYSQDQLEQPQVPLSVYDLGHQQLWVLGRIGYVYSVDIGTDEWLTYEKLHFQCESTDGTQWFRASKKEAIITKYDPRTHEWLQYDLSDGLIDTINVVTASSHGLIWAAGSHNNRAAICVFNGTKWRRFLHPEFAEWIEPHAVMEAMDGTMWFGAGGDQLTDRPHAGGALQYRVDSNGNVQLLHHHRPPNFPYYISAFAQSTDQTIWLGAFALYRYLPGTENAVFATELQGFNTANIRVDLEQSLWVAKSDAGVYRYKNGNWSLFSTREGIAGARLADLLVLRDGSILAATGEGISRFDGHSWTKYAYPAEWTMSRRWNSMHESADGSIWFNFMDQGDRNQSAETTRIGQLYTIQHRPETTPPKTQITDYLEQVSQPGNSHFSWSARDPWSRTPRDAYAYSWRLNGDDWSAFSPETGHTFLNLSSGKHLLEVRARDLAFNVDPSPARVEFSVIPPIWQQPWFLTLISVFIGLIALLLWQLIRTREKHLIQQQHEREIHLKELDRIKIGFFTNISHELRTPLTVISGRLKNVLNQEMDGSKKKELSIVFRNIGRMSTLVTQLLDFQKIEKGTITENVSRGDLAVSLQDWVTSMQVLAEDKQIRCALKSVDECLGSFDVDKIQKIFTNLISNAIKYTETGGEIRVKLHVDKTDQAAPRVYFSVEDNGIGIPEQHLSSIFERFYRVPEASMASGAGIGLNLVKELVDLLGGTIQAESPIHPDTKRPGTRFSVTLPFNTADSSNDEITLEKAEISATLLDESPALETSPLILVVEDDTDIRNFIVESLERMYRVVTAENGNVGLQMAKELIPELIVTDVMMPVMDGMEMCQMLKSAIETSHIPVVMLTAKASVEHQLDGLKTGADDYIAKPFHMELLQVRIANLLESRRLLREQFRKEDSARIPEIPDSTMDNAFVEKAIQVLEEQSADVAFKLDPFATALNMSPRTLQRKLKAVTDRTPMEFINEFRMARAGELLRSSPDTIAEIAYQVGMDEPSNFTRLFKAHFQMTPSQYRAKKS